MAGPPRGVDLLESRAMDEREPGLRAAMVREQIAGRGVADPRVLAALERVPRHRFVPADLRASAYDDTPLPIGHGATISQPYVVGVMSELAAVRPGDRVLEVGVGSGYQSAVLAELGAEVFGIEVVPELATTARATLEALGYGPRVEVRAGDGAAGWPERAPFQAIVVAAAPRAVPPALREQLAEGGRLVIPVGGWEQELMVITRRGEGFDERAVLPVRFVPLVGSA